MRNKPTESPQQNLGIGADATRSGEPLPHARGQNSFPPAEVAPENRYELLASQSRDIMLLVRPSDGRILEANTAATEAYGYTREELLGLTVHRLRTDESREEVERHIAMADARGVQFETTHRRKDGRTFPVEVSARTIEVDRTRVLVSVIRDIAERRAAEAELRRNTERFALLTETAEALLGSEQPQQLVEQLCRKLMRAIGCDVFFNFLVDEKPGRLRLNACAGVSVEEARNLQYLDIGTAVCGCVARDGQRVIAECIQSCDDDRTTLIRGMGIRAYCCHPLLSRGRVIGTLSFGRRYTDHFDPDEVDLMRAVANQVALAMQRVAADQELRRRKDRLDLALKVSGSGTFDWDAATDVNVWSDELLALYGLKAAEFGGRYADWIACVVPEDRRAAEESVQRALATGDYHVEFRIRRIDTGDVRWMLGLGRVFFDSAGKPARMVGINTDITEQKLADVVQRRTDAKIRAVFDSLTEHVIFFNKDGLAEEISPTVSDHQNQRTEELNELTGRGRGQLVQTDGTPLPVDQQPAAVVLRTGKPLHDLELGIAAPDGRTRWLLVNAQPVRDRSGVLMGAIVSYFDVTERRTAAAELRRQDELFRTLADTIANLAWWADADGSITWYNRRWYEYTGKTPEEMKGWGWQSVHDPALLPLVTERWKEALKLGQPFEMEFPLRGADGNFRWFLTRIIPVRDASGNVTRWFGTNTDVSELREAREVLARSKVELERLVDERTRKLQELVGELEHFSYTITHDMRAPLRAMKGYGEVVLELLGQDDPEEQRTFLKRIMASADRMDALIRDALSYNQAVRQELPLEWVDADKLMRSMLETYPEFQPARARIRIQGELPTVLGNEAGLTQCFSNLLGNAVKFVEPGRTPEIRVWSEPAPAPNSSETPRPASADEPTWVRLWICDNGIGIPENMLPRIFDMFSRANKNYEGTGIGLALVRKVVQRMGGRLGVESTVGEGSRFWIELQRAGAAYGKRRD